MGGSYAIMKQKPTFYIKKRQLPQDQQQPSPIKVDEEVWSIECTVDELQLDLCKTKEEIMIDRGFYVNGQRSVKTLTVHKYYRQARELMKRIPIARPPPEFVINTSDLSPKLIEELEARLDNPPTFAYILKAAAGRIFENLDFNRYHQSIARSLKVRLEP
jgi:hypothetical protein